MCLWAKLAMLQHEGFRVVARSIGRIEVQGRSRAICFEPLELLSFFRADLLVTLVLIPAVLLAVIAWLRPQWRAAAVAAFTLVVVAVLDAEVRCFDSVGTFHSASSLWEALLFGVENPEFAREYVGPLGLLKLVTLGSTAVLLAFWASRAGGVAPRRLLGWAAAGLGAVTLVSWVPSLPATPYHRAALPLALGAFLEADSGVGDTLRSLSPEQLLERYRRVSRAPYPRPDPGFRGRAGGFDLVLFVLETAPARCLDLTGDLEGLPTLRRLRRTAWVAAQHTTSFPYTSSALLSIICSRYPPNASSFGRHNQRAALPGLAHGLQSLGYETAVYCPGGDAFAALDRALFARMGMARVRWSRPPAIGRSSATVAERIDVDHAAFTLLKRDVSDRIGEGRRFAVMFLPQIGRAPWPELPGRAREADLTERGKATIALQEEWLGELVSLLETHGRLQNTLIAVMGDHGIRTRGEDPRFQGGMIDEYTYRVPLLVYAPGVLAETVVVPWVTSHIDVAPTLLDLLGVEEGRESEQGSPLWDERVRERVTFLAGAEYLGADGYHDRGRFFMRHRLTGATYASPILRFTESDRQPTGSAADDAVVALVDEMTALRQAWSALDSRPAPGP